MFRCVVSMLSILNLHTDDPYTDMQTSPTDSGIPFVLREERSALEGWWKDGQYLEGKMFSGQEISWNQEAS